MRAAVCHLNTLLPPFRYSASYISSDTAASVDAVTQLVRVARQHETLPLLPTQGQTPSLRPQCIPQTRCFLPPGYRKLENSPESNNLHFTTIWYGYEKVT